MRETDLKTLVHVVSMQRAKKYNMGAKKMKMSLFLQTASDKISTPPDMFPKVLIKVS